MKITYLKLILCIFLFSSCGMYTDVYYKVKNVGQDFNLRQRYDESIITSLNQDIWMIVYQDKNDRSHTFIKVGMEFSRSEEEKKSTVELLNKVKITHNRNVIDIPVVKKEVFEDDGVKRTYFTLQIPDEITGNLTLDMGKIKIGNVIFKTPLIYLQKYKITESNTLLEALLSEGGENVQFYKKEGWIDN